MESSGVGSRYWMLSQVSGFAFRSERLIVSFRSGRNMNGRLKVISRAIK